MTKPDFTVVIPAHNAGKYISRTVSSVLSQTYSNFELIVVDDGSTDHTVEILEQIQDPRLRIIRQKNRRVGAARNRGIAESRGEHIAFLDADDEWLPRFLENMRALIEAFPEAGVYSAAYLMEYDKKPHVIVNNSRSKSNSLINDYFDRCLFRELIHVSCAAIPRKILNEVGLFVEGQTRAEDIAMWTKIALKYPVAHCPEVLSIYRQTPNSGKPRFRNFPIRNDRAAVLDEYLASKAGHAMPSAGKARRLLKQLAFEDALMFAFDGDFEHLRQYLALPECRRWRPVFSKVFSIRLFFPLLCLRSFLFRALSSRLFLRLTGGRMIRHGMETRLVDRDEEPFF